MNPRGEMAGINREAFDAADVEGLKEQIEDALKNVEEIKRNNAIVSVATGVEEKEDVTLEDDEIILYVSVKIQKNNKSNAIVTEDITNEENTKTMENGIDHDDWDTKAMKQKTRSVAERDTGNGKMENGIDHDNWDLEGMKQKTKSLVEKDIGSIENAGIKGKAIRPRRKSRQDKSKTAPNTPSKSSHKFGQFGRSLSTDQPGDLSSSLENLNENHRGSSYNRIRRVRSKHSVSMDRVWLPGRKESFNTRVSNRFVRSGQSDGLGKLQYYYYQPAEREKCNH